MLSNIATAWTFTVVVSGVYAATSFTDDVMTQLLDDGGLALAAANAPVWFFGQSQNQPPCIPTWAYSGSATSPDIYDEDHRTAPAGRCENPNVGCNCEAVPGVGIGNPTPAFPVYYTYQKCNDNEVRVSLNLFYEKDGFLVDGVDWGHDWDWERVVIVYAKDDNNMWAPSHLLPSQHSGYGIIPWGNIQNTLTTEQAEGDPRQNDGIQNQDHPKVYVAWSKHPNFDDRNTGFNDPLSQIGESAFRSNDWWFFVPTNFYIRADDSTAAGQQMKAQGGWGSADNLPPLVNEGMCNIALSETPPGHPHKEL